LFLDPSRASLFLFCKLRDCLTIPHVRIEQGAAFPMMLADGLKRLSTSMATVSLYA